MKYENTKSKFQKIWRDKENAEQDIDNAEFSKEITLESVRLVNLGFHYTKKIYKYESEWELAETIENRTYKEWRIEIGKFPLKYIPYIKTNILYKTTESDIVYTSKVFHIIDTGNEHIKTVTLVVGMFVNNPINIEVKLVLEYTNPEYYV